MKISEIKRNEIEKDEMRPISRPFDLRETLPFTVKGYKVSYRERSGGVRLVGVIDGDKVIAELGLIPISYHGISAYAVELASVAEDYQGRGLGLELYRKLVTDAGMTIASKHSHSQGARKTWARLSAAPGVAVYGFNTASNRVFEVSPSHDGAELAGKGSKDKLYGVSSTGVIMTKVGSQSDGVMQELLKLSQERSR